MNLCDFRQHSIFYSPKKIDYLCFILFTDSNSDSNNGNNSSDNNDNNNDYNDYVKIIIKIIIINKYYM